MRKARKPAAPAVEILKAYNKGASLVDLKQKFGISGKAQLAKAIFEGMIATGKMPSLKRGRKKQTVPTDLKVAVNKRGTIVLRKEMVVDAFRFKTGQSFMAAKRGKKIILTSAG